MLMKYEKMSPDFAMFIISDPDGLTIAFAGKP